jgi:hypothetical protein
MENQNVEEKKPIYKKKWFLITVGIIVVLGLLPKGNNTDKNVSNDQKQSVENTNSGSSKTVENPKSNDNKSSTLESKLTKEIESIKKGIDFTSYRGNITSLQIETTLFKLWSDMIKEGQSSTNQNEVKLSNEMKKLVEKIQVKELPLIRKEYVDIVKEKLWEDNITVSCSGRGNNTINLESGRYFSNKVIAKDQETISEIIKTFRFKKSTYKAYDGQDEFTYYTLDTPNDNELY